jgi:hypothetical protein
MLEMRYVPNADGGITAPIIVCDHCREEITNCRAANLLWLYEEPQRQYHVHKACDRAFESALARERGKDWLLVPWIPLDRFLDYIGHNAGLGSARRYDDVLTRVAPRPKKAAQ